MTEPALAFSRLMQAHRSIRQYDSRPIDPDFIDGVLEQALHGSSSSGNLNMMSVIKTRDTERKARLCELHFGQPMVLQAPLVLTFCADSFRTREWPAQRSARAGFADLVVGWPAEQVAQRDRLPPAAWIQDERYQRPTPADIDAHFGDRERRGWDRYRAMGPEMVQRMQDHGITSLAQFYTSQIKYDPDQFAQDSAALRALLEERGFLS